MLDKLHFPVILLSETHSPEIVVSQQHLTHMTALAFKHDILTGSIILAKDGRVFEISSVVRIGNLNPWWRFEFFNPMLQIDLILTHLDLPLIQMKQLVIQSLQRFPKGREECRLEKVLGKIQHATNMDVVTTLLEDCVGTSSGDSELLE